METKLDQGRKQRGKKTKETKTTKGKTKEKKPTKEKRGKNWTENGIRRDKKITETQTKCKQNKGQKKQKEENRKKNKGRKKRKGMWIEHAGYHRAGSWILCSCLYNLK